MTEIAPNVSASTNRHYKIVFVVGNPRSGTTWTMWLLGRHPSIVAGNHFGIYHALQDFHRLWIQKANFGGRFHLFNHPEEEKPQSFFFQDSLDEEGFAENIRAAIQKIFDVATKLDNNMLAVVEQTPENLEFWPIINLIFPNAYFIHVIRDPRAIHASMRQASRTFAKSHVFPHHPIESARLWMNYMLAGDEARKHIKRYRQVKYENLVSSGPEEIKGIYEWLGLPLNMDLCEKIYRASSLEKMKKIDGLVPDGFLYKGISNTWKKELPKNNIRLIEYVANEWMHRLGYKPMFPDISALTEIQVKIYNHFYNQAARLLPRLVYRFYRLTQRTPILRYFVIPPRELQNQLNFEKKNG